MGTGIGSTWMPHAHCLFNATQRMTLALHQPFSRQPLAIWRSGGPSAYNSGKPAGRALCTTSHQGKGAKGRLAEGVEKEADIYRSITGAGNDSHLTQMLYGGGPPLVNSAGVPWTAAYIDTIGEPTADLRSNIAAEARAKIVYERLINLTDDPGVKDALTFLMTREIAHQKSFEKALYSIEPNFPPGKRPGDPAFTHVYFDMSKGNDVKGPWNDGANWDVRSEPEQQMAVDGGSGEASVGLTEKEEAAVAIMATRTASDPTGDPMTGAQLGMSEETALEEVARTVEGLDKPLA
ncbi:MAG: manganese catalase family protein [Alcaligenaceae bacterium]|nr:MAG: manganese catalase family protein [Alcaligenaceae bacterium]